MTSEPPTSSTPQAQGGSPAEVEGARPEAMDRGIPEAAEGSPTLGRGPKDFDVGEPVGPTPERDFWEAIYTRRSIRKFDERPVPRELADQVMHAGIWAPSSCNYQMWDLVAVDDPEVNAKLAALSSQMGNAPTNIVVSYGREFSEESWANIQSASAMIQNMSLAAQVLGLGTFWITQTGDKEAVRELVGLPYDRLVVAVLALGYPKFQPKSGPKRRPLDVVRHWNHYGGRPIPSSPDPAAWHPDDLAVYQRARVLNGLRHNKPRPWEVRATEAAIERFVERGADKLEEDQPPLGRWLDVLPCTGIVTERTWRQRRGFHFDVVERTKEVGEFVANRVRPVAGIHLWSPDDAVRLGPQAPPEATYAVATCLFRLEDLAPDQRGPLLADIARWLEPGGELILGLVSTRSFHSLTERLRSKRGGPRGVEYVLSPDPNIGPFEAVDPRAIERLAHDAGFETVDRLGLQAAPQPEELAFRTRNFSERGKRLAGLVGSALGKLEQLPGVQSRFGRFQFLRLRRR
ncbi:nitroreductase family protein [Engelhardtia mirabilis]|uniref:NADPH-flavin oxidoreductase n=1 Tax=Engelhardtia mirabilis TaxID=2528011 RepID=A0A518BQD5_9BACT|nr:NADPH-flavin oxidoreductase [Planctomycetes bacterium Pla133]QDV03512.1 NADPH-flavin oxidoreductase [Planctomycetes bacterium Pla86]